ncbi:MAG: hypothetical protein K9J14_04880 [Polynucleobacter sp.]|nr:hypothetical protein [Polynucleobacter sp.]
MPRPKRTRSDIKIIDISDTEADFIDSLDKLIKNNLKSSGRGNRADIEGIGQLMRALYKIKKNTERAKGSYLNSKELANPEIIDALETLGIFKNKLNKAQIKEFKQSGKLPAGSRITITKAAEYYVNVAIDLLEVQIIQ